MNEILLHRGPSLSPREVSGFERRHGVALPGDYREFLLRWNGGMPVEECVFDVPLRHLNEDDSVSMFFGIGRPDAVHDLDRAAKSFEGRLPHGFLPIASCGCGDTLVLDAGHRSPSHGAVHIWTRDDWDGGVGANLTLVARSFDEFLRGLYRMP